ncbi:MAG: restriction endonuclease [Boseongicola sp. SB0677_bin_26]|nr:restriction endonuclease [Boseongicola sp. SB0665_bin_10]MYG28616.1 restriction endonuclease [Boseongicola sp. SB0677_bin_26]
MKIAEIYSHLNGEEWLRVHAPGLWGEVRAAIKAVDAEACKTKVSKEKTMRGRLLYSPDDMNAAFKRRLGRMGWKQRQNTFWVTADQNLLRGIYGKTADEQKAAILEAGYTPIRSYNQTDFVKDRVAIEVQFGKYAFVAHDLFVKHLSFYVSDIIDVGIEILPMKSLESRMSSGVPYYERDLLNVIRQGRGVPAVPLVLVGIEP